MCKALEARLGYWIFIIGCIICTVSLFEEKLLVAAFLTILLIIITILVMIGYIDISM